MKASKVDKKEAMDMRSKGLFYSQIAAKFGVSKERIRQIVNPSERYLNTKNHHAHSSRTKLKKPCLLCGDS
jgi:DNA-directed RNA polymerase sigma subunit (sigma70/sigma32)